MQFAHFHFELRAESDFTLPDFKGSTFRGKFGHVLKRTICLMRDGVCESCELRDRCAYPYLFETKNEREENVPRPFVIGPPLASKRSYHKGDPLQLQLTLVGKSVDYLPYFVYCFERMGKEGIGRERGRYSVVSVKAVGADGSAIPVYDAATQELHNRFPRLSLDDFSKKLLPVVTISFLTATTLKSEGRPASELTFELLLKSIVRRYRSLCYFHGAGNGSTSLPEIDWQAAQAVEIVHSDLTYQRFNRYSNRQRRKVPLAGFTGQVTYSGNIGPFLPWLKLGEYLHVGKGVVFGLGWYRVVERENAKKLSK